MQVRDNIHFYNVARFIEAFIQVPRSGEAYTLGDVKFKDKTAKFSKQHEFLEFAKSTAS